MPLAKDDEASLPQRLSTLRRPIKKGCRLREPMAACAANQRYMYPAIGWKKKRGSKVLFVVAAPILEAALNCIRGSST